MLFYSHKNSILIFLYVILSASQNNNVWGSSLELEILSKPTTAFLADTLNASDPRHLDEILSWDDALHLERRVAIGTPIHRTSRYVGKTRSEAIKLVLKDFNEPYQPLPSLWFNSTPLNYLKSDWKECSKSFLKKARVDIETIWIKTILESTSPAHERLVLFWSNHFSIDFDTYSLAHAYWKHHSVIRQNASGNMRRFLNAILRDPGILIYLNNNENFSNNVNENLAREYLELFSLGEGNYAEQDVKSLAKLFSGHSVNRISQNYEYRLGASPQEYFSVLNHRIKTLDDAVEIVLHSSSHAKFIATKFYREYISLETPSEKDISTLTAAYYNSEFSIIELLKATLELESFWNKTNRYSLIKAPIELLTGTARTIGIKAGNRNDIQSFARLSRAWGQNLLKPPNVAGWPGGMDWIEGGRIDKRLSQIKRVFRKKIKMAEKISVISNREINKPARNNKLNPTIYINSNSLNNKKSLYRKAKYKKKVEKILEKSHSDQLVFEALFLLNASPSFLTHRNPTLEFALYNAKLGERYWDGFIFKIGHNKIKNKNFIRVESTGCYPACLKKFNVGFWNKKEAQTIKLDFSGKGKNVQKFNALTIEDQLLLKRLAQIVHIIPQYIYEKKGFAKGGAKNTEVWREWIEMRKKEIKFDKLQFEQKEISPVEVVVRRPQELEITCYLNYEDPVLYVKRGDSFSSLDGTLSDQKLRQPNPKIFGLNWDSFLLPEIATSSFSKKNNWSSVLERISSEVYQLK